MSAAALKPALIQLLEDETRHRTIQLILDSACMGDGIAHSHAAEGRG